MGYALKIYEAFREYGEEKARVLAEAFEELEKRYPQILDMATKRDLSETELRLIKEIEDTRKEIKELELKLTKEIEDTRKEIKELELKLTKEVEQVRLEVEEVRKEIKEVELKLTKEIEQVRFSTIKWIAGLIGGQTVVLITTFFTLLKLFLH
jgi:predicted phage-related endonuclease